MSAAAALPAWWHLLARLVGLGRPHAAPAPQRVEPVLTLPARRQAPHRAARAARMRINPQAVALARLGDPLQAPAAGVQATPFTLPKPLPGVLPNGAPTMAMDEAIGDMQAHALASSLGGGEGLSFLGYPYLAELAQRPEYRRISEIIAREMTRKWIKLTSVGDEDKTDRLTALGAALERFGAQDVFRRAAECDGFFGRAQIYLDTGHGSEPDELRTPLVASPAKVRRGGLKRLAVIEPYWTYPGRYNTTDPLAPDFFKPGSWYVMGKEIHASRLLTLIGREMPDMLKPAYSFGGLSMSQMAKPYVDNWIRTRQSVSDLVHSFSTTGLKTNLEDTLNEGSGADLQGRAALFNLTRDNSGLMLVDKETEELFNVATPLGTLDKLQAQAQEQQASVAGVPLVKLLGITPSGLNASSDGEIRSFEDGIHSAQEALFNAPLQTVIEIVQLSEFGEIDPDIRWHWVPLHQLSEAELATLRKANADTAAVYVSAGVVSPEDERRRLCGEEDGLYNGLDPDDLPDPPDEDPADPDGVPPGEPGAGPAAELRSLRDAGAAPGAPPGAPPTPGRPQPTLAGDRDTFKESDHPRKADGKFGSGAAPAPAAERDAPARGSRAHMTATAVQGGKRVMPDGSPLPAHIAALKLPPAWTDVQVSHDPDAALQAVGKDAKGRRVAVYSDAAVAREAAAKFSRVSALAQQFDAISAQNDAARQSADPKVRDAADCLALVMQTGIRPGSEKDTGAEKQAYGATTLKGEHVKVTPDGSVRLEYTGKKGVSLSIPVEDPDLAEHVKARAAAAGPGGKLFPAVSERSLLDHTHSLGSGEFKTKDFRTHLGTRTASELVDAIPAPNSAAAYQKAVKQVATEVSRRLGNTPTIALASYINPTVFAAWRAAAHV